MNANAGQVLLVDPQGRPLALPGRGYRHFAG
jgi:hypothetical protein